MLDLERACNHPNFFDTSEFLTLSLHFFGCIALPVHLFGGYCILFHTPKTMKSMKLALLNFHFGTCFLDFGLSLLSTPYIFVPALAGYPLGILSYLGVPSAEQTYFMFTVVTVVVVSIIGLFENRFFIIMTNSTYWKIGRRLLYIVNHVAAISCFLLCFIETPEQSMAFVVLRDLMSCMPSYVDQSKIFILTIHISNFLIPGAVCFDFWAAQILLFPFLTNWILSVHNQKMSENTRKMQRNFQKALVFQVVLPVIILAIPIVYIGVSTWKWYHNQAINNIALILLSSHGFFSTIAMIMLHSAYREYTLSLFLSRIGIRSRSTVPTIQVFRSSFTN